MNIIIRVDASTTIGSGHVMRCLTLAQTLAGKQNIVEFVCRELPGNLIEFIQQKGFKVHVLPYADNWSEKSERLSEYQQWLGASLEAELQQLAVALGDRRYDLLIVDHYALDLAWEVKARSWAKKIMVVDDLANRQHDCDLLLDQNFYLDREMRYQDLVPVGTRCLLGPKYALLRPEFLEAREKLRGGDGVIKRILVFFGGSDETNETGKALRALSALTKPNLLVEVVVGSSNPHKLEIEQVCEQMGFNYYCQINNMAELMAKADLAIGAGGSTTWERCCLGLPAIVVTIAANQVRIAEDCAQAGVLIYLGAHSEVDITGYESAISHLTAESLRLMGESGARMVDGFGAGEVASQIMRRCKNEN